jgi:hypothetical protein
VAGDKSVKVIKMNSFPSAQKPFFTFVARTVVMLLRGKMDCVAENLTKPTQCVKRGAEFIIAKAGET